MELRQLGMFVGVADELHFGRAAERLFIAQPALSQHIRRLESELGVTLFDRGKRRVRLTAAGAVFYPEARRILDRADRARVIAREAAGGHVGTVMVGHIAGLADGVVATWLGALRQSAPGLDVHLQGRTAAEATRDLADGEIDIAILDGPIEDSDVESLELAAEPLVAVMQRNGVNVYQDPLHVDSLSSMPWVVPHRTWMPTTSNAVETWRAAAGATVISEARSISEWLLPVAAGYAVTLAPVSVANPWPDLTTASVADVDVNAAVSLCWRADAASPQVLAALQVAKHVRLALRRRSASIEPCSRTALAVAS